MKAFTIIELILVMAILMVLMTTISPFLSSFLLRNNWHVATDRVRSESYKAQNYAMDGKLISGSSTWGICVTGNVFRMFNGSCGSPNYREDFTFPAGSTISGISSITFDNLRGTPSAQSTINIVTGVGSSTVTLGASGMIE